MTDKAPRILSVQSHTTHGYVGNKAATFPLQTLGFDVNCINTVSLSNHPAYRGGCKGNSLQLHELLANIEGLENNNLLNYDAVITGYISKPELLEAISTVIAKVRANRFDAIYICDPVLGDNGKYYVPEGLTDIYRSKVLPLATVITPNYFEAEALSGRSINKFEEAIQACGILHGLGPKIVVLTGINFAKDDSQLTILISYRVNTSGSLELSPEASGSEDDYSHHVIRIEVPKFKRSFSGCGDLFTALVAASINRSRVVLTSRPQLLLPILELVSHSMSSVLQRTAVLDSNELCIIESRDIFQSLWNQLDKLATTSNYITSNSGSAYIAVHPVVAGIIFDMDGTLTEPGAIDFEAMYTRNSLKRHAQSDILNEVSLLPTEELRQAAMKIIEEEERLGWQRMKPRPDLIRFLSAVRNSGIRTAIATRNSEESFGIFLEKAQLQAFSDDPIFLKPALFRDSLNGVNKPDAKVAEHVLSSWDILPSQKGSIWFVGDSKDDMLCGKNAGCSTCLIRTDYNRDIAPELVDLEVDDLLEFGRKLNIAGI